MTSKYINKLKISYKINKDENEIKIFDGYFVYKNKDNVR